MRLKSLENSPPPNGKLWGLREHSSVNSAWLRELQKVRDKQLNGNKIVSKVLICGYGMDLTSDQPLPKKGDDGFPLVDWMVKCEK